MTFGRTTLPTAAKPYRCEYCFQAIPAGQQHVKWEGVDDGQFYTHRFHGPCEAAVRVQDGTPGDEWYSLDQIHLEDAIADFEKAGRLADALAYLLPLDEDDEEAAELLAKHRARLGIAAPIKNQPSKETIDA